MEQKVAQKTKVKQNGYTQEMDQSNAYNGKLEKVFSERLTELMKYTTQKKVAKSTGISRQNLSKYMLGRALPNAKNLFILAKHFDVSCDYLFGFINLPHNELSHFRLKINFSTPCTKKLEYISKDVILSKLFDRLITNDNFIQLLRYIDTYLTFSAKPKKFSTDKIKENHQKIEKINIATNSHISYESIPQGGIKISDIYIGLIQAKLQEILSKISKDNAPEYTEKITRMVQEELSDSIW